MRGRLRWAAVAALCLASGMRGGAGKMDMINVPVSPKIPHSHWPRPGVPDYSFTVRSYGGQALGIDVKEFDWTLEVQSRPALVSVESFRSDADIPGQPIGVFRQAVDDQQLTEFDRLVREAKLDQLQPAMKRHPGYTERRYAFVEAGHAPVEQVINNSDEETNAKIQPLRSRINFLLSTTLKHAERAVRAGIAHSRQAQGDVFEVTVTNIGVEKVCFADPRWIVSSGPLHRAAVMISEFPKTGPGEPPPMLQWQEVPLESLQPRTLEEPLVTLEPGGTWKGTARWKPVPGKRYLAFFTWANYVGKPMVNEVYRIRGRADSPRLVIEP